ALGIDPVADHLLEDAAIGKAAVALALPDEFAVERDLEYAAGAGHERHRADLGAKGREQFLRHPGRSQHPVALGAIGDRDRGLLPLLAHLRFLLASAGSTRLARIWSTRSRSCRLPA